MNVCTKVPGNSSNRCQRQPQGCTPETIREPFHGKTSNNRWSLSVCLIKRQRCHPKRHAGMKCKCFGFKKSKSQGPSASYLLIFRCLVAIVVQLEIKVLVLLEEILNLILLCKRGREKTTFRTPTSHHDETRKQRVVRDSPCIIHLRRRLEVLWLCSRKHELLLQQNTNAVRILAFMSTS